MKKLFLAMSVIMWLPLGPFVTTANAGVIFSLSFDNTLNGGAGEVPTQATGVTFVPGVSGSAAHFPSGSILQYASGGNINSSVGTLEFFLTPDWNGNDGQNHVFLSWGGGGGMIFGKDAANNLRGIFRRFGIGGPETQAFSTPYNLSSWMAGETRHLVFTWDDSVKVLNFFLNGSLGASTTYTGSLPPIGAARFQIGGDYAPGSLNGSLDELRIYDTALSAAEVAQRYAQASAVPEPATLSMVGTASLLLGCLSAWRRRKVTPGRETDLVHRS